MICIQVASCVQFVYWKPQLAKKLQLVAIRFNLQITCTQYAHKCEVIFACKTCIIETRLKGPKSEIKSVFYCSFVSTRRYEGAIDLLLLVLRWSAKNIQKYIDSKKNGNQKIFFRSCDL